MAKNDVNDAAEKYGFTRQYHVVLTEAQKEKHVLALQSECALFQYALKFLYKTYGYKHLDRKQPRGKQRGCVLHDIKARFIKEKFQIERWNVKRLGLSSQAANEFLKTLWTNFWEYRKELEKRAKAMDKVTRYNYKANILKNKKGKHTNPKHKAWYRKGAINFLRDGASFSSVSTPNQKNKSTTLSVIDKHTLHGPDWGTLHVCEDVSGIDVGSVAIIRVKRIPDGTYRLQLVFMRERDRGEEDSLGKVVGYDWNMAHNEAFRSSDNKKFFIPQKAVDLANKYEDQINKLKSKRDLEKKRSGVTKSYYELDRRQRRLYARRKNLLTDTYRKMAHDLVDDFDTIVLEKLSAVEMRIRESFSYGEEVKKKNINRKLAVVKPYEFQQIILCLVRKQNKKLKQVDCYYTSKACHECGAIFNDLKPGQKTWICPSCKIKHDRDYNATLNILDWGLHPEHHAKLTVEKYKDINPKNLVVDK